MPTSKNERDNSPTVDEILDKLDDIQSHLMVIRQWAMLMKDTVEGETYERGE